MRTATLRLASLLATLLSVVCTALAVFLAAHAYRSSKAVGAGAAQGDLGFYLVLRLATPALAIALVLAMLLDQVAKRKAEHRLRMLTWLLSLAAVLVWSGTGSFFSTFGGHGMGNESDGNRV